MKKIGLLFTLVLFLAAPAAQSAQVRIKSIANVKGVRENQLIGYGLVVGLQQTGDTQRVTATLQSVTNMLAQFGIVVSPAQIRTKNVAAVMVTAQLPALVKSGDKIDVTVSSIGDAQSLQGGNLLLTPLQGPDGQVYAAAQGPLAVGGYSDNTDEFPLVQTSQTNVGRVPSGALVEREVPSSYVDDNSIAILLTKPDFGQASMMVQALNQQFGEAVAKAADAGEVDVKIPFNYQDNVVDFVAAVENTQVFADAPTDKVVINERTGTVVLGQDVRIDAVAIAHGNLRLVVRSTTQITRDAAFGKDEMTHTTTITTDNADKKGNLVVLPDGATLMDVVTAINAVGATPRDLISILQAVKAAGALHADLEII
ncbi:MAG TPA: flagellar basal body P-ring protein FlgI [bacterium]|nr:flagellar basal body P-ring protein FlgI [bacterium]